MFDRQVKEIFQKMEEMEEGKVRKNKYNRADGCADIKNMVYNTHLANQEAEQLQGQTSL